MTRQAKDQNHFIRFGEGSESRSSIDIKLRIIGIVVYLLAAAFLLLGGLDPETDNLAHLVHENANLVAVLISHQLTTFDAHMLLAIKVNRNIVRRKADRTTTSKNKYQSPTFGLISASCLLLRTLNFD